MTKPRIKVKAGSRPVADVVRLDMVTRLDIDPICVLDGAMEADLTHVVIAGYRTDGSEYFAASMADGGATLWLIERLKKLLLEIEPEHLPPMAEDPEGAVLPFRRKGD